MSKVKQIAQRALGLLDLTSLNDNDTEDEVRSLCSKAVTAHGPVAAVCVWPRFVSLAVDCLKDTPIKVAAVANFPDGGSDIEQAVTTTRSIVESGGDEVDVVFPYQHFLKGDIELAGRLLEACKKACGDQSLLKVILETGCMPDTKSIRQASDLALNCGADFIKTSTGKVPISATPEAAEVMLEAIRDQKSSAGFKASGGIKDVETAAIYLELADEIMGQSWVNANTFRFGASSVLSHLLAVLEEEENISVSTSGY